jgi:SAM-dependent methyltransferase
MACWHELDGVTSFSSRAEDYAFSRPGYPWEAIAYILRHVAHARPCIVDVGAGTAQGTRALALGAGFAIGLEPNLEMIRAAPADPRVGWLRGRAEHLPLLSRSVDLLTVFGAFHWFKPEAFLGEARRVLRPSGRLALVWNDWDHRDPFTAEFVRLMRGQAGDRPPEDREAEVAPLYETTHFVHVDRRSFPLHHRLDLRGVLARMRSVSYAPNGGCLWESLERELRALFERHANANESITHHYTTEVFVATPRPSTLVDGGSVSSSGA